MCVVSTQIWGGSVGGERGLAKLVRAVQRARRMGQVVAATSERGGGALRNIVRADSVSVTVDVVCRKTGKTGL